MTGDVPEGVRRGEQVFDDVMSAPGPPAVGKDRREHAGMPPVDDDELAARTEEERVDTGLADYDPDDVPPATDDPVPVDLTDTEDYRAGADEVDREVRLGVLPTGEKPQFPPTRYPDQ
jgi:hypothetical protein